MRNRRNIANVLATLLLKLPPPPLTIKEVEKQRILDDLRYSTHDHFETTPGDQDEHHVCD